MGKKVVVGLSLLISLFCLERFFTIKWDLAATKTELEEVKATQDDLIKRLSSVLPGGVYVQEPFDKEDFQKTLPQ